MDSTVDLKKLGYDAAIASQNLALASTEAKNESLANIASVMKKMKSFVLEINAKEVVEAQERGLPAPMIERMTLNDSRYQDMIDSIEKLISLPDPVGRILDGYTVPSGLSIMRRTVPLGVVGVIYESRPNVTVDIASLCLKSGNACILRGGSECFKTNLTLYEIMEEAIANASLPHNSVNFIKSTDRELVNQLLTLDEFVDVIIPRGGESLHRMCAQHSSIPVIVGGFGVSHIYVDSSADIERAVKVIVNAKVQKPSACNALDTLLVHRGCAVSLLHNLTPELAKYKVLLHVHGEIADFLKEYPYLTKCTPDDLNTEFLGMQMNIVLVDSINDAILHIRKHKAIHSDSILTNNLENAELFARSVPSACVYINASTRFTDGGQFGMGAEVAISTQKLHVRGPMSLDALTTYQYICHGDYLAREK